MTNVVEELAQQIKLMFSSVGEFHNAPLLLFRELSQTSLIQTRACVVYLGEQVMNITELAELYETEQWSKAAQMLSTIDLNFGSSKLNDLYKLFKSVHVAHLYLKGNDVVNAEAFIKSASLLVGYCPIPQLHLQYMGCYARFLYLKGELKAAFNYYDISAIQMPESGVWWLNHGEPLTYAVKCAIAAAPCPSAFTFLEVLMKDERCSTLKFYPILRKVYLKEKLTKKESAAFAKELKPHQVSSFSEFMNPGIGVFRAIQMQPVCNRRLVMCLVVLAVSTYASMVQKGVIDGSSIYNTAIGQIKNVQTALDVKISGEQDHYTFALTWGRSFGLEHNEGALRANQIDFRFYTHGLWPPNHHAKGQEPFNEQILYNNVQLLANAQLDWPNLHPLDPSINYDRMVHDMIFWRHEWVEHGDRSLWPQKLYMQITLAMYAKARGINRVATDFRNAMIIDDPDLRLRVGQVQVSTLITRIDERLHAKPEIICKQVGLKTIISEVRLNASVWQGVRVMGTRRFMFVDMISDGNCTTQAFLI